MSIIIAMPIDVPIIISTETYAYAYVVEVAYAVENMICVPVRMISVVVVADD